MNRVVNVTLGDERCIIHASDMQSLANKVQATEWAKREKKRVEQPRIEGCLVVQDYSCMRFLKNNVEISSLEQLSESDVVKCVI